MSIQLQSSVPLPKSKNEKRSNEKRRRIFAAFRNVYKQLYIIEPDAYTFANNMMYISADGRVIERASEKRIVQLTRMMRERLLTR